MRFERYKVGCTATIIFNIFSWLKKKLDSMVKKKEKKLGTQGLN